MYVYVVCIGEDNAYLLGDVQGNVKLASKQLDFAEHKLAASEIVSRPDVRDEEGLPLTEIREKLDEEGNVICVSLCLQRSVCGLTFGHS